MRQLALALFAALAFAAHAGEGIALEPIVRVPGEKDTLTVSESLLAALGMTKDDAAVVMKKVEELNKQRPALFTAVREAKKELRKAQQAVDDAQAALAKQEAALDDFIRQRLADDRKQEYSVRVQIQPVVDWLKISEDKAAELIAKQRELLANDPRPQLAEAQRAMEQRPAGQPLDAEQRQQYIALLKRCVAFNQTWQANIESVLTPEQKDIWRTRYRRTAFPVEGLAPAPGIE